MDAEATHQVLETRISKAEEVEAEDMAVADVARVVEGERWEAVRIIRAWMIWDRSRSQDIVGVYSMKISQAYLLRTRNVRPRPRDISKATKVVVVVEATEEEGGIEGAVVAEEKDTGAMLATTIEHMIMPMLAFVLGDINGEYIQTILKKLSATSAGASVF